MRHLNTRNSEIQKMPEGRGLQDSEISWLIRNSGWQDTEK
jgi:hypothetical protein